MSPAGCGCQPQTRINLLEMIFPTPSFTLQVMQQQPKTKLPSLRGFKSFTGPQSSKPLITSSKAVSCSRTPPYVSKAWVKLLISLSFLLISQFHQFQREEETRLNFAASRHAQGHGSGQTAASSSSSSSMCYSSLPPALPPHPLQHRKMENTAEQISMACWWAKLLFSEWHFVLFDILEVLSWLA